MTLEGRCHCLGKPTPAKSVFPSSVRTSKAAPLCLQGIPMHEVNNDLNSYALICVVYELILGFFTYSLVFYGCLYTLVFFDAEASEPENVPNEIATPPLFHWLFAHIYWHCSPHADAQPEVTNHLFDLIISRVRPQIGRKWAQRWLWNYQDPIVGCCIQLHPSRICVYIYIHIIEIELNRYV